MNLKPVCFLLSLCFAGSAAAIGLGTISVRSHLGQPLHATVKLIGAIPNTPASCFTLDAREGSIAPPLHATLSVEQSGGQTQLAIRTSRPLDDPILQFVLISDCGVLLQRDYVVLLDPPVPVDLATRQGAEGARETTITPLAAQAPVAAAAALPRVSRRPQRVKPAVSVSEARPSPADRPAATPPPEPADKRVSKPRLVISGKRGTQPDLALPLQPGTTLPDTAARRPPDSTAAELSDDNTALSRRIADLEMQLATLKKRNAELDARRAAAAARMAPPDPDQPARWPLYLLAIGLLAAVGAFGNWMGRRRRVHDPIILADEGPWERPESVPPLSSSGISAPDPAPPRPERMPEVAPPALTESTEVRDDILDQAEVCMAHGHGELATHLLQEHLQDAPTESPVPWLLLLDLLHRAGDTTGYATTSAECKRYFNINLSNPPVSKDIETGDGLEAYPHLFDELVHKWNSPDINAFFDDLIYDQRGGTRLGFDPGAYRELLLLRAIAQDVMPLAA